MRIVKPRMTLVIRSLAAVVIVAVAMGVAVRWLQAPKQGVIDPIPAGDEAPLRALIPGIPGPNRVRPARIAITPTEPVAVQGQWMPRPDPYTVRFVWRAPDGRQADQTDFTVQPGWRRTLVHYRGPRPLQVGEWHVGVRLDDRYIGRARFEVVASSAEVPYYQQQASYRANRVSHEVAENLTETVHSFILGDHSSSDVPESIPEAVRDRPLGLAIRVFSEGRLIERHMSLETPLESAIAESLQSIEPESGYDALEITFVHEPVPIAPEPLSVRQTLRDDQGFRLIWHDQRAHRLPIALQATNFQSGEAVLGRLTRLAGQLPDRWREPDDGFRLSRFKVQTFVKRVGVETSSPIFEVAYGREAIYPRDWGVDDLRRLEARAVGWFVRNQEPSGRYLYAYRPDEGRAVSERWILRELNALFVLAELARHGDYGAALTESLGQALDAYSRYLTTDNDRHFLWGPSPRDETSIAATAFLLATLATRDRPGDSALMAKLAGSLADRQAESGRLRTDFRGEGRAVDQLYYPGETLLALMRYYQVSQDPEALAVVERAFPYYQDFWSRRQEGPFVPWQVRAYAAAYEATGKTAYRDYVFRLQDWLLDSYPPLGSEAPIGQRGAFAGMFASTGVYAEGLVAAYRLARATGDTARTRRYREVLEGNINYLAGLQFTRPATYYLPHPERIVGAFAMKPYDNTLRLDSTYHALSAIHMARRVWAQDPHLAVP